MSLTQLPSWLNLQSHYHDVKDLHLRDLFAHDPERAQKFSIEVGDIFLDFSKNRITQDTLNYFFGLLQEINLSASIQALFTGQKINTTENRAVLHTALRNRANTSIFVDNQNIMPQVNQELDRMSQFATKLRSGEIKGSTDLPITNIVNIGIGGSNLGPQMAFEALKDFSNRNLTFNFISNLDPSDFWEQTHNLNPATTLFIVASKTFTTKETLANARNARDWIIDAFGESAVSKHFLAISTNSAAVANFGIDSARMFESWDWVGGRYSLPSAIGLPLMIAIGPENFFQMLDGYHAMDEHFRTAPFAQNLPVILAIISCWYTNFFDSQTQAILPYSQNLHLFPSYLQQLEMESNGKSATLDGQAVDYQTSPIIWGEPGTNSQHSFFQLLHQGTKLVPIDFISFWKPNHPLKDLHQQLLSNLVAQSEALAFGQDNLQELHRHFPGNHPSSVIMFSKLNPYNLGQLIALYEHKTFVLGKIWHINSFDQFGVELGKQLANTIDQELVVGTNSTHDSSTLQLIQRIRQVNQVH